MTTFHLPDLGEGLAEAEVVAIKGRNEGDAIRAIGTAKADAYKLGVEAMGTNFGLLQIFSVLAEEQNFAGVHVTLGLYLFVILRAIEAARLAKDRLGAYLVLGVLASFTFQVIYNVTMSAGLAPVKGLTLPLMSYGGSSMIATLAAFGLILNVRMRRFTN